MQQLYQDSMACIRTHGKPDLFITFTCNPAWPEIEKELLKHETANDRPDLVSRVFNLKLKALCDDLLKKNILGLTVAHIYVIEWQKRGLPHAHILVVLNESDKVLTIQDVNAIVSAEIPDAALYPLAYETVSKCLMHGPCGAAFPNAPCMVDGLCSKKFPKPLCEETYLAADKLILFNLLMLKYFIKLILDNNL
jgi:hypothetical protein